MGQDDDAYINDDCDRDPTPSDKPYPPHAQTPTNQQTDPPKNPRKKCNWNRIFSGTVALFTIVLAVVSWYQWRAMRDQLDAMKDAERPWVGIAKLEITPISLKDIGDGKLSARIYITNAGGRPASNLQFPLGWVIAGSFPQDPAFPGEKRGNRALLVPGATTWSSLNLGFTQDTIREIEGGKVTFYIFAKATYQDTITERIYWTTTCYYYVPEHTSYLNCEEYNDAT